MLAFDKLDHFVMLDLAGDCLHDFEPLFPVNAPDAAAFVLALAIFNQVRRGTVQCPVRKVKLYARPQFSIILQVIKEILSIIWLGRVMPLFSVLRSRLVGVVG